MAPSDNDFPNTPTNSASIVVEPVTDINAEIPGFDRLTPEQVLDLARRRTDGKNELLLQKENNRHVEECKRQNIALTSLVVLTFIISAAFLYSGITGDRVLSERVLTLLLGALGGSGVTALILKPRNAG